MVYMMTVEEKMRTGVGKVKGGWGENKNKRGKVFIKVLM